MVMKRGIVKIVAVIIVALILGIVAGRIYYETKMVSNIGIGERILTSFINWLGEEGE